MYPDTTTSVFWYKIIIKSIIVRVLWVWVNFRFKSHGFSIFSTTDSGRGLKHSEIDSNLFLYAGIYANLSFKQYQKELKKLTKLVIAVHISYDRTYGYSWKIHQWISIRNFSISYPLCLFLYRQYHFALRHYRCLTIVMWTRNEFHAGLSCSAQGSTNQNHSVIVTSCQILSEGSGSRKIENFWTKRTVDPWLCENTYMKPFQREQTMSQFGYMIVKS